jgi:hypothetical protein
MPKNLAGSLLRWKHILGIRQLPLMHLWGCVNLLSNTGACEWGLGLSASVSQTSQFLGKRIASWPAWEQRTFASCVLTWIPVFPECQIFKQNDDYRYGLVVFIFDSVTTCKVLQLHLMSICIENLPKSANMTSTIFLWQLYSMGITIWFLMKLQNYITDKTFFVYRRVFVYWRDSALGTH